MAQHQSQHQPQDGHHGDRHPDGAGAATQPSPAAVVALRWAAGRPVVALSGEVDVSATAQVRTVGALLERHGQRAAVDASEVAFLDAAGLGAVLELAGPGGSLLVLRPSPAVLRLLDLLELSGLGPSVLRAGPREEAVVLREAPSAGSPPAQVRRRAVP